MKVVLYLALLFQNFNIYYYFEGLIDYGSAAEGLGTYLVLVSYRLQSGKGLATVYPLSFALSISTDASHQNKYLKVVLHSRATEPKICCSNRGTRYKNHTALFQVSYGVS